MAKIGLTEGFSLIPEGTHIFCITAVNYKEAFGKLEVTMQTKGGSKHIERFSLLKSDGSPNEGALNAFSYFAKTALNDFELSEIDHEDLIGCFIECDVEHEEVEQRDNPGKTRKFPRLVEKRPSEGWDDEEAPKATPAKKTVPAPAVTKKTGKPAMDLAALLG